MKKKTPLRSWLALAALLVSGNAAAAHVTPTSYDGNFTSCTQLNVAGVIGGSSGTAPTDPQTYPLGGGHTITFDYNPNGSPYIDFTATVPMDYVIIKGGPAYNVYAYDPAVLSDTGLHAPINPSNNQPYGVSHVAWCFKPRPTASKTAEASWKRYTDWEIDKVASPTSVTMFDGDSHEIEYTVTATPTTRGEYRVAGTITVRDPFAFGWVVSAVNDTIQFNNSATQFSRVWDGPGGSADTMTCSDPNTGDIILSCSYEFLLSSTTYPFLLTATGGANSAGITAKKASATEVVTATANFTIPSTPAASYGDNFAVNDSALPGNPDHTFTLGGSYSWVYERTFTCNADGGTHNNTATGTWSTGPGPTDTDTDSDSASVTVNCRTVTVAKDATTRYTRDYAWTPVKYVVVSPADAKVIGSQGCLPDAIASGDYAGSFLCTDASLRLNPGDSYDTVYKLVADQSIADEHTFAVSGNITVSWPSGVTPHFNPATPSDTLHFTDPTNGTQAVTPSCGTQGATSLACTYSASLPRDLVPGYNEASIDRVKKCYDEDGVATDCGTVTYTSNQALLTYGAPSAENNKCVAISDLFNGIAGLNLGPSFSWNVNANACADFSQFVTGEVTAGNSLDIFANWLLPADTGEGQSCTFAVPNKLILSNNGSDTAGIGVEVTQLCDTVGCTYTQGYWKTHVDYAAKPQFAKKRDAAWDLIDGAGTLDENAMFFTSGKTYIQVMWTAPKGNPYYLLAHQYIAAKLNVLDGASDSAIAADLAQAEAWFAAYGPGHGFWKKNQDAIALAGKLASYNEGAIGPGHCSVSPATELSAN